MTETKAARHYDYALGAEPIASCGAWKPWGPRILCRAILDTDWQEIRKHNEATHLREESERIRKTGDGITAAQLLEQATAVEATILPLAIFSALDVAAFVIVAVGAGVAKWCKANGETCPVVGQHCDARSVSADRIGDKQTGRYWAIHVEDLCGTWDAPTNQTAGLVDAINAHVARKENQAVRVPESNGHGEVELSPAPQSQNGVSPDSSRA